MGIKDTTEKYLESYDDVFLDIYNVLLFGREVIKPEDLKNGETETTYKAENGKIRSQLRDTFKNYYSSDIQIASLGIENQLEIDKDMPIRILGYDYAAYRGQIDKGTKGRYPVITLVLNFSRTKWEEPVSLLDILEIPEEIRDYVQGYEIKVFNIAYLPKETRDKFKSDFKVIADFFSEQRLKTYNPVNHKEEIKHVEAVLELLRVFTADERYEEIKGTIIERNRKGGSVTMCEMADEFEKRGMIKGEKKGEIRGEIRGRIEGAIQAVIKLVLKNKITVEDACEELDITSDEFEQKIKEYKMEHTL